MAARASTLDLKLASGDEIPIEERDQDEVLQWDGSWTAPAGFNAMNFAFDVTPSRYVTAIITEYGVARAPYLNTLSTLRGAPVG